MIHGNAVTQVVNDDGVRSYPDEEQVHLVPNVTRVRMATAAALPACTLTGNVLEADSVGAIGAIDTSVTPAVGDLILLKNQVAGLQNGVHEFLQVGGAAEKFKLRRAIGWDVSARVKSSRLVTVAEGTLNGDKVFSLTTNDPITLNTTALAFGEVAAAAAVTALEAALALTTTPGGASYVGVYDAATQITATTVEGALAEIVPKTIQKRTVHVAHGDLTGATTDINLGAVLPTNAVVLGREFDVTEQFAGEADCTVTMGGTDADGIVASTDLDAMVIGKHCGTDGIHPTGKYSAEQLALHFAATALGDLTAGEMDVTAWYFVLA
jgi:hypothetical protein